MKTARLSNGTKEKFIWNERDLFNKDRTRCVHQHDKSFPFHLYLSRLASNWRIYTILSCTIHLIESYIALRKDVFLQLLRTFVYQRKILQTSLKIIKRSSSPLLYLCAETICATILLHAQEIIPPLPDSRSRGVAIPIRLVPAIKHGETATRTVQTPLSGHNRRISGRYSNY